VRRGGCIYGVMDGMGGKLAFCGSEVHILAFMASENPVLHSKRAKAVNHGDRYGIDIVQGVAGRYDMATSRRFVDCRWQVHGCCTHGTKSKYFHASASAL